MHCALFQQEMSSAAPKKKKFTRKQLRASQSMLTQQAQTNIYASQVGMTPFGAVRHGGDIRVTELYDEGEDDEYPTDEESPPTKTSSSAKKTAASEDS